VAAAASESGGPEHRGERVVEQRRDRGPVAVELVGAGGQHQQDGEAVEPPGEVAEEAQRRLVGPVHVVDGQHEGRAVGQVDGEPVQPVGARPRDDLAGPRHHRGGERGRAGQQLVPPGLRERDGEQLPDQPVRRVLLQLAAPRAEHRELPLRGATARRGEQPGLADARRPLDHEHRALARARRVDEAHDDGQLVLALQERYVRPQRLRPPNLGVRTPMRRTRTQ